MSEFTQLSLGLKIILGFSLLPLLAIAWLIVTKVPVFLYKLLSKNKKKNK